MKMREDTDTAAIDDTPEARAIARLSLARDRYQEARNARASAERAEALAWSDLRFAVSLALSTRPIADPEAED